MAYTNQYIGLVKEGTWGTAGTPTEAHRIYSGTFVRHEIPLTPHGYLGQTRDPASMFKGIESGSGKIRVPMVYNAAAANRNRKLLAFLFGADESTVSNVHTFKLPSSVGPGWTIESHMDLPDTFESFRAEGSKCSGFQVRFAPGDELIFEADVSAQQVVQVDKTALTDFPVYPTHIVHPSQVLVTMAGQDAWPVKSVEVNVNHNLLTNRGFLGSQYIGEQQFAPGFREVTGTIVTEWSATTNPTSKTIYDYFMAGTTVAIVVKCTHPTLPLSQWWTMAVVQFTGETPEPGEGGVPEFRIPFRSLDHADSALKLVQTEA